LPMIANPAAILTPVVMLLVLPRGYRADYRERELQLQTPRVSDSACAGTGRPSTTRRDPGTGGRRDDRSRAATHAPRRRRLLFPALFRLGRCRERLPSWRAGRSR